jgi:hypothetical protein
MNRKFIEKRVKIDKNLLKDIIIEFKVKNNYTWDNTSEKLRVSAQALRVDWLRENRTVPLSIFKKLISSSEKYTFENLKENIELLDPFWGQKKSKKGNFKKVSVPNQNTKEFAEFWGIMMGDGCIYSGLQGFCITGHKNLEKDYYHIYLKKLIEKLFSASPGIWTVKDSNTIRCYFYSKRISSFLTNLGFPVGKKKDLSIPLFFNKEKLIAYCIRGLFDTDGSLSGHPNAKIMIHLSITDSKLKNSIDDSLKKFGIKTSLSSKSIYIYGKERVSKFIKVIGSSNPKNLYKYNIFIRTGKVPTSKETEDFLMKKG